MKAQRDGVVLLVGARSTREGGWGCTNCRGKEHRVGGDGVALFVGARSIETGMDGVALLVGTLLLSPLATYPLENAI